MHAALRGRPRLSPLAAQHDEGVAGGRGMCPAFHLPPACPPSHPLATPCPCIATALHCTLSAAAEACSEGQSNSSRASALGCGPPLLLPNAAARPQQAQGVSCWQLQTADAASTTDEPFKLATFSQLFSPA